jgi:hypothetical protein
MLRLAHFVNKENWPAALGSEDARAGKCFGAVSDQRSAFSQKGKARHPSIWLNAES